MKYQIIITKFEDNKNYEAQVAEYKDKKAGRFVDMFADDYPQIQIATRSLEAILTEEEFTKFKAEALKIFN